MSDIERKKKKKRKVREEETEADSEQDDEIKTGYVKKKKKRSSQHQEQEEQNPTTSLIVSVDNEKTKFPFRFTPGTLTWQVLIDDLKSLCEVSQHQQVSLTDKQKLDENCLFPILATKYA